MPARARGSVVAVVLVGFAVRAGALLAAGEVPPVLDEETYLLRAEALLAGEGYVGSYQSWVHHAGRPAELPQYPGAWQPPGQTTWLAVALALGGGSATAARFAQVLLGTLAVWLVYALGRNWFGQREGLIAAALCALYPNLIAYSHYLWSEPLFIVFLLAGIWRLTAADGPPGMRDALLAGAFFGAATLTRAAALYFTPLAVAWLIWAQPHARRDAARAGALVLVAAFLVVLPWTIRNSLLHDGIVLVETNAPYNLWRGNGPDSFAGRGEASTPHYGWPFESVPLAPVGNRTARRLVEETRAALGTDTPSDLEVARHASAAARQQILEHPTQFLARVPTRIFDLWNPTSFLLRHLRIGAYGPLGALTETAITAAAVLSYLALLVCAAWGVWSLRREPKTWLVLLLAVQLTAMSAVAFGLTRFRLPAMPLFMLLAAAAWVRRPRAALRVAAVALAALSLTACDSGRAVPQGPNLLWVVWDTARADRLGVYGHDRDTTPRLDTWAQKARVFENATSPAGYTLPSHASMFTGLLPSEHCTFNGSERLDDRYETFAELVSAAGWRTYLYSANPQISAAPNRNFAQGFDVAEHPWSPRWRDRAIALTREKLDPADRSSELTERLSGDARGLTAWNVKASGSLAQRALLEWLDAADNERPWFAFLNYMEAHRPLIPAREYRERLMSAADTQRSYQIDRSWLSTWEFTFGLRDYTRAELRLTRETYDAALGELDDLFADLLAALDAAGQLENTIVVLTSDHGELLGEHHMLDHQYSLHEPLLRVPLLVLAPGRVEAGRDAAPVTTQDLFPTLLELLGVATPPSSGAARSLLRPLQDRIRLAEDPASSKVGIAQVLAAHPGWDPTPFRRSQRALYQGPFKYWWGSDARDALYDLSSDPGELRDLGAAAHTRGVSMRAALDARVASFAPCSEAASRSELTSEQRAMLESLGYLEPEATAEDSE